MCVKVEYGSEHLAANAAVLHTMVCPECPGGFHAYPCSDHWHVGHKHHDQGETCKQRHADYHRGRPRAGATLQQ